MIDLAFLFEIVPALLAGLPLTLQLAASSIGIGFVMALLLALAQQGNHRIAVWPIRTFVAVFRGTPLLVQIFLIYYGLGQFRPSLQSMGLWWLFREPYWCAIVALSLNTAAYGIIGQAEAERLQNAAQRGEAGHPFYAALEAVQPALERAG